MLFNYHTHTYRCNHAIGTGREYVEKAIEAGIKTLGFSDHAPYIFPNGYRSSFRMKEDELCGYADEVRALAKEYEKDIRILLGFELEYYPDYHREEVAFLRTVNPDYLLLGQHYLNCEEGYANVCFSKKDSDYLLQAYVTQVISGLATGDFLYLAHPDVISSEFSKETVEKEFTRLCDFAKKNEIPLEINLLGLKDKRHYPCGEFFEIAGRVGNDVIIGIDAHSPEKLTDKAVEDEALSMVKKYNLNLITKELI